jgi:hypothetical protein
VFLTFLSVFSGYLNEIQDLLTETIIL